MNRKLIAAALIGYCLSVTGTAFAAAPINSKSELKAPSHKPQASEPKANMQYPFINGHYALTKTLPMNGYRSDAPTVLVVDKGSHSTYVLQLQHIGNKDEIVRVLTLSNAIGTEDKPTPSGRYLVAMKKQFPTWIPPKTIDKKQKPVPPYNQTHKNPLGVAAIYLNKDELALHGTNEPKAIRKSASHGCIRHSNSDISKLYGMVKRNTPVYIVRQFVGTVLNRNDFIKESAEDKKSRKSELEPAPFTVPHKHKVIFVSETC
ncbi:MAG TPA: L,D-transpeptidase [Drouetiella sp.]